MSRLRALALSPVPYEGAGCRFRIAQYIPYLETQGIDLTIAPFYSREFFELVYRPGHYLQKSVHFLRQTAARLATVAGRGRHDLVLIYREAFPIGPPLIEAALSALKVPLVYDFDDAVFLENTSAANRRLAALKCPGKIAAIIRRCDQVIAGNDYLAAYARRYNRAVQVIPTAVDVNVFAPRAAIAAAAAPPVVGWIGTPTTAAYLDELGPVLHTLAQRHGFVFRVAGANAALSIPGVAVDNRAWSLDREVDLFNTCDIGVYPLRDDEWAQGKCGFKAIQFMACGVPVVAAAVGVNREIIEDGVNGFLAGTPDEWQAHLHRLLGDADLRRRIGAAGRRTIQERYSIQVNAPRIADVLWRAASPARSPVPLAHVSGRPQVSRNFAMTGVGGFVAARHLKAINDTGNRLVAAVDPHDAVGVLDRYSFGARFFTEIERFDRHLEKLRRASEEERVHYVSICSPNYLHDAHIRFALRVGAHAICEKPLVINPWNLDPLQDLERETGQRISTVLQLRVHPTIVAFRDALARDPGRRHRVTLTYVTARGPWYDVSWKGSDERSGGLVTNIGIHLFDLLLWLFGPVQRSEVHQREPRRAAGVLELERADVRWFLSAEASDLPFVPAPGSKTSHRSMTVDGEQLEFSDGFANLHTRIYEEILAGRGFGIDAARPSIELTHQIRHAPLHGKRHDMGLPHDEPPPPGYVAHESAYIDDGCRIGDGTRIWHFSHVMSGATIGARCNIGQNVVVSPEVVIGDNVKIQNNVSIYTGVILEDDVFCGPSMVFTNVVNPRSQVARKHEYRQTLVRRGASLGANCTVVCGHTIGRYAFIGAGTVITRDVPDYALVVGNPGRVAGWVCRCGVKLASGAAVPASATCAACRTNYAGTAPDRLVAVDGE